MNDINDYFSNTPPPQKKNSDIKSGIVGPLIAGALGASIIIGICFGVPTIKSKIIGENNNEKTQEASTNTVTQTPITTETTNNGLLSLEDFSNTTVGVANKVLPSIVGIDVKFNVTSNIGFGMQYSSDGTASGSGIIISKDGYILTNNHIVSTTSNSSFYDVSEATSITVYLYNDETPYEAKIIGTDSQTDLAVIKIDKDDLTPAELGDSSSIKVGEFAMAIGNPLGLKSTVTCGIISATKREVKTKDGINYSLIQTDAAINSGNSGGALVNSKGQVIGINSIKISATGVENMGFAIPINDTIDIYKQLIEYKKVKRPTTGITGIDLNESTAKKNNLPVGIYVKKIDDFSAAEKAGIKTGDVIIEADGKKISTTKELTDITNSKAIGDSLEIKFVRNNEESTATLTLQEE